MARKKKKKAQSRKQTKTPSKPKPLGSPDSFVKVCPFSLRTCLGPECRLWVSPDESDIGECIILLAGLRILAGDDEGFGDLTKKLIQEVAAEGGKGLTTMFRNIVLGMLSKSEASGNVSSEKTDSSVAGTANGGLRGVEEEE